jgi:hypothetical protein
VKVPDPDGNAIALAGLPAMPIVSVTLGDRRSQRRGFLSTPGERRHAGHQRAASWMRAWACAHPGRMLR